MAGSVQVTSLLGIDALVCGESLRQILALVKRVAQTPASVLITGESGTGKELIARAIHHYSLRCSKPWVDVNCGALPEHLVESELFGYEKGAFSGADSVKPGLFETANTGTLFLDEIGELEPRLQIKLLRVLDGVPYYRLGGVRKVSVDVRIVAATNQDIEEAINRGEFRRDLYHRLRQMHIQVPPLRQRQDEIVPLAEFFLAKTNPELHLSPACHALLQNYPWPGNIRELKNIVFQAAVLVEGKEICPSDLHFPEKAAPPSVSQEAPLSNLESMEQATILRVLRETGGHHERAAAVLGISRRTLSRKLKSYGTEADVQRLLSVKRADQGI
jgi:transcriptional regulator with PAS, ATPase and Fis domain